MSATRRRCSRRKPMQVRIVGIAAFGSADGFGPSTFTGMTLDAAQQHLTDSPDRLTEIRVEAEPGVSPEELASRIGCRPAVERPSDHRNGARRRELRADRQRLPRRRAQRARRVRRDRAARRRVQHLQHVLDSRDATQPRSRAACVPSAPPAARSSPRARSRRWPSDCVGSAVGWSAGVGLAGLLKAVFDSFGFALPAGGLVFEPTSTAIALVAGVVATVVAGVVPSVRGSRVPPVAALRDLDGRTAGRHPSAHRHRRRHRRARARQPVIARRRPARAVVSSALGAVACLVGAVVLGPVAARPAAVALGRPDRRGVRGLTGTLARQNAMRHPRRTAATAAALMVGVSVVALFTVFGAFARRRPPRRASTTRSPPTSSSTRPAMAARPARAASRPNSHEQVAACPACTPPPACAAATR